MIQRSWGKVVDEDGLQFFWNHYQAADIPFQFAMGGSTQKHFQVVKFPPMLRRSDSAEVADAIRKRKRKVEDEWTVVRDTAEGKDAYTGKSDVSHNLEDTWLDSASQISALEDQSISYLIKLWA